MNINTSLLPSKLNAQRALPSRLSHLHDPPETDGEVLQVVGFLLHEYIQSSREVYNVRDCVT